MSSRNPESLNHTEEEIIKSWKFTVPANWLGFELYTYLKEFHPELFAVDGTPTPVEVQLRFFKKDGILRASYEITIKNLQFSMDFGFYNRSVESGEHNFSHALQTIETELKPDAPHKVCLLFNILIENSSSQSWQVIKLDY